MKLEEAKQILNENGYLLNESVGWNIEEAGIDGLDSAISNVQSLIYELENCDRGSNTDCHSWKELGEWIKENVVEPFTEVANVMIEYNDDLPSDEE